jgi:hypothetical protein
MLSLFVQVTVVPADTVIVAGVNDMFAILTELGGAGVLVLLLLLLEQEKIIIEASRNKLTIMAIVFFIFMILNCELKMITLITLDNEEKRTKVV